MNNNEKLNDFGFAIFLLVIFGLVGWLVFFIASEIFEYKKALSDVKNIQAIVTHVDISDGYVGLRVANYNTGTTLQAGKASAKYSVGDRVCFDGVYNQKTKELDAYKFVECK